MHIKSIPFAQWLHQIHTVRVDVWPCTRSIHRDENQVKAQQHWLTLWQNRRSNRWFNEKVRVMMNIPDQVKVQAIKNIEKAQERQKKS